jgi:1-acyl-sn-glycerol-3-phosphate acyltransferase
MTPVALALAETDEAEQLHLLTLNNTKDLIAAFQLDRLRWARGLLELLCWVPARRFARQLIAFDRLVGEQGLPAGGEFIVERFARRFTLTGAEHAPSAGPLLVVSNHPGMADAMALWAGLARTDLLILAAERPLLHALPKTGRHLIYVDESGAHGRTGAVRAAVAHLRRGGAVLTFPAGKIEPDPAVRQGAAESLVCWAPGIALLIRLAPDTLVLPAAVGGVISTSAQRNPAARVFRSQRDRDWAAATLQILVPAYRDVHTRVAFGPPISAADLVGLGDATVITQAVTQRVRPLLDLVGS